MSEVHTRIDEDIKQNDVVLFMKGTKFFPMCGFSKTVVDILNHLQANFETRNVLDDENLREGIKTFSNWPTIPQLYIKGEFVGGCDIVRQMFEQGELQKKLDAAGATQSNE